jgi:type VI secretion system protein ImpG
LGISGDSVEDPHVERLLQSTAFLSARVHKKLEDEYSEFTHSFLQVMYPHYLRPVPSCSMAQFEYAPSTEKDQPAPKLQRIPRHASVQSKIMVDTTACVFNTTYEVCLSPLRIVSARYDSVIHPPSTIQRGQLHPQACGAISIEFDVSGLGPQGLDAFDYPNIRVFIDAEASMATHIREAILHHSVQVLVAQGEQWAVCPDNPIQECGFAPEEGLFHYPSGTRTPYRLLTEFFVFNEKFNFFDISTQALRRIANLSGPRFHLKCLLPSIEHQFLDLDSRLLERIEGHHFKLHCTPVVNLFEKPAVPVSITGRATQYTLLADAACPHAYEIYDIHSMQRVSASEAGPVITPCRPLFSVDHGNKSSQQLYWNLQCDESLVALSPGFEYQVSLTDPNFDAYTEEASTLSIQVFSTNRNLPLSLPYGQPNGDLELINNASHVSACIRLLRKPTKSVRFARDREALWRLIAHLNLNQWVLAKQGAQFIKESLQLYNVHKSISIQKMIDGIVQVRQSEDQTIQPGSYTPRIFFGLKVTVEVRPEHFTGMGVRLFARVLDHYLASYVQPGSFSRLVIEHAETHEEILKCPPRNGQTQLV